MTLGRVLCVMLALVLAAPALAEGLALDELPRAAVTFVAPVLAEDGTVASEKVGGTDRLIFEEVPPGKDAATDKVRAYLEASPAWELVLRLYGFSAKRLGAVTLGTPQTPGGQLVLAVTEMFGSIGPSHAGYPVTVRRKDGSTVHGGSFLVLSDVHAPPSGTDGPDLTLDVLMKNDYLALALAHECGHQMMWDRYGAKLFPREKSLSRSGHDVHRITDPQLAFTEGWAEAFAAIVGDWVTAQGRMPRGEAPALKQLIALRHEMVERDRFIYEDHLKKTGRMKSGLQLVSTEGVVAFLVWQSYASRIFRDQGQPAAFGAVLDTIARHHPRDVVEFWAATMKDAAPVRDKLLRIFLEGTRYGTVSAAAPSKYFEMWSAQRAAQKLPWGHAGKQDAARDAHELEQAWTAWKEQLYAAAVKSGRLDAGLPPGLDPVWLDHGMRRIGLNLATPDELAEFRTSVLGAREDHLLRATTWVELRDGGAGYFKSLEELATKSTPEEMSALRTARGEFEAARKAATAEAVSVAAYLQHRGTHGIHARMARMLGGR